MKKILFGFLCAVFVLCIALNIPSTVEADNKVPEAVMEATNSVVRIVSEYADGYSTGSGFVIFSDKENTYVATNYHVVDDDPLSISIWVDEDETLSTTIYAWSKQKDLCILRLAYALPLNALKLNTNANQGDAVFAVGFPGAADYLSDTEAHMSCDATITDGIISALRQTTIVEYGSPIDLLQINAAINHGNSGGPLFNSYGEVVGINTYGTFDSQGIFGAISVSELIEMMHDCGIEVTEPEAEGNLDTMSIVMVAGAGVLVILAVIVLIIIIQRSKKGSKIGRKNVSVSLRQLIDGRETPLSLDEAVSLLIPIAKQIKGFHDEGIVHLEISPEHITVNNGVARLLEKTGIEANMYSTGFTAPEVYSGKNISIASDIYSFCAVLKYAVSGNIPENALVRHEKRENAPKPIMTEEFETVTETKCEHDCEHVSDIASDSERFFAIVDLGMKLEPAERYQEMQNLICKLAPYNTGVAVEVQPAVKCTKKKSKMGLIATIIIIPLILAILVAAALGVYANNYQQAIKLALDGKFSVARDRLLLEDVTAKHDEPFISYLDAGIAFENRDYSTARKSFEALGDYRNASELAVECDYRQAAQFADAGIFDEAIIIYDQLSNNGYRDSEDLYFDTRFRKAIYTMYELEDYESAYKQFNALSYIGYEKADDMAKEAVYLWASQYVVEADWISAYEKFSDIRGYSNVDEILSDLEELIYLEGQKAYRNEDYFKAAKYFGNIKSYKDTYKYVALIQARRYVNNELSAVDRYLGPTEYSDYARDYESVANQLMTQFEFEDTKEILMMHHRYACVFLEGTWESSWGDYYFRMSEDQHINYNLPWFSYGDYYSIENGEIRLYKKNDSSSYRPLFKITLLSVDCMDVYCYKDSCTYRLFRK